MIKSQEMNIETDQYYEKFDRLRNREFTGRCFNATEFLHHLTNINFHFECGNLSKLSDNAINKIKLKFRFHGYGGRIDGIDNFGDGYVEKFLKMVDEYGKKYGFKTEK